MTRRHPSASSPKRSLPCLAKSDPALGLGRGYRCFYIRIQAEILIEPRAFKNHSHSFLRTGEQESSAFVFQALHRADQDREAGAVDVRNAGEIHDEALWFLVVDDRAK